MNSEIPGLIVAENTDLGKISIQIVLREDYTLKGRLWMKGILGSFLGLPCWLKNPPAMQETRGLDPWAGKIPLGEDMATHSSILAWRISMESGA